MQYSVAIISDSIAKYVKDINNAKVLPFSGATIHHIFCKIRDKTIDLTPYSHVMLHVGTNNVVGSSSEEIQAGFSNLISVIRDVSDCKILISSILPRPVDFHTLGVKVKEINSKLESLCKKRHVQFIASFKRYFYKNAPVRSLFAYNDGLHLSFEGTRHLRQCFINVISHL